MRQISLWMAPYSSTSHKTEADQQQIVGVYLEALDGLPWLTPELVARARQRFNKGEFGYVNTDFQPKPAQLRKMITETHEQHATDEATRLSGYIEGDWAKRDFDPEARARCENRMKLFNEFRELDTFDQAKLTGKVALLGIADAR